MELSAALKFENTARLPDYPGCRAFKDLGDPNPLFLWDTDESTGYKPITRWVNANDIFRRDWQPVRTLTSESLEDFRESEGI